MAQPVLYRAHPTERLLDAIVVVPVDVFVDQREHLPTGVFLPPLGVDGLDLRPAEETLRGRVVQRTALRARRSGMARTAPWVPAIPAAYGDGRGRNAPEDARPRATWRSITGEGCALPSAVLVSVMSVVLLQFFLSNFCTIFP